MKYNQLANLSRHRNEKGYVLYFTPSAEQRLNGLEESIRFKSEYDWSDHFSASTYETKSGAMSALRSSHHYFRENHYEVMEVNEAIARLKANHEAETARMENVAERTFEFDYEDYTNDINGKATIDPKILSFILCDYLSKDALSNVVVTYKSDYEDKKHIVTVRGDFNEYSEAFDKHYDLIDKKKAELEDKMEECQLTISYLEDTRKDVLPTELLRLHFEDIIEDCRHKISDAEYEYRKLTQYFGHVMKIQEVVMAEIKK